MGLLFFHVIVINSSARFTESELAVAKAARERGKKVIFTRNKVDDALDSMFKEDDVFRSKKMRTKMRNWVIPEVRVKAAKELCTMRVTAEAEMEKQGAWTAGEMETERLFLISGQFGPCLELLSRDQKYASVRAFFRRLRILPRASDWRGFIHMLVKLICHEAGYPRFMAVPLASYLLLLQEKAKMRQSIGSVGVKEWLKTLPNEVDAEGLKDVIEYMRVAAMDTMGLLTPCGEIVDSAASTFGLPRDTPLQSAVPAATDSDSGNIPESLDMQGPTAAGDAAALGADPDPAAPDAGTPAATDSDSGNIPESLDTQGEKVAPLSRRDVYILSRAADRVWWSWNYFGFNEFDPEGDRFYRHPSTTTYVRDNMLSIAPAIHLGAQCGPKIELATAKFGPYPGYGGPFSSVTGKTFVYDLSGLDTGCNGTDPLGLSGNACGIHIHSGFTCSSASEVGGHYYLTPAADPWSDGGMGEDYVAFYSTTTGTASGNFDADTGATTSDLLGRAFVVHDADGGRVACALMEPVVDPLCVTNFATYPGYYGAFPDATGCAGGYNASFGNSCGLHIHSGSSCEAASEVGGHYATNGFADPWTEKSLSYVSSTNGNAEGKLSAVTGGTSLDVLGKAFVVHGYDGGRIACGTLEYCDPCGPPPPPANVCMPWCKNNPDKHCPKTQLCGSCYFCYH
ncbi:hypothetical protein EMIHUDRAFT_104476 [Emiliania huxleyi CCMP1516]|uniref:IRG-type G domain-containing protein n=2 Tax=Emiliania huxleyi TaxID=2903 RepID=A0A0D3IKJ2_EMIH1|nr:hypothetical protein EMIHUDRAFT_104476 [Emiliania huxleyi CCMP1516]EOD11777.1 hypothetical protein EMIHUDRAFT_104476 [Emiliania huxleyi CCMP1516]|eukprot:XP_005764206.1 hypothetical protein EMIHUDRAFT_104476 [Emiliania huxleyi CCMP1516]